MVAVDLVEEKGKVVRRWRWMSGAKEMRKDVG